MKGVVKAFSAKGRAFNVKVDSEWYGFGFDDPEGKPWQLQRGDIIEFDITRRGNYVNIAPDTVKVVGQEEKKQSASKPSSNGSNENWDARAKYWEDKEQRDVITQTAIQYQSSRNAAIEVVDALMRHGLIKLPAKQADQYDAYMQYIDTVTQRFEEDVEQVKYGTNPEPAVKVDEGEKEYD